MAYGRSSRGRGFRSRGRRSFSGRRRGRGRSLRTYRMSRGGIRL